MPNWCNNSINISGDDESIKKLLIEAKSEESDFTLNNLIPIPKEQEEDWYNWRVSNWGTKWDIGKVEIEINEGNASFNCETAWAPPNEALQKISEKYPTLTFEMFYEEPGMDFCGKVVYQNGEALEDVSTSYSENFNTLINFEKEKATIENGIVKVPCTLSKKEDPYDFDAPHKTVHGTLEFSFDLEPDDFESSICGDEKEISFVMSNEEDNDFVEQCINENAYDVAQTIEDEFDEIKTTANYNYLNQSVPENGSNKKRKKL